MPLPNIGDIIAEEERLRREREKRQEEWEKRKLERARRQRERNLAELDLRMREQARAQRGPRYTPGFYDLLGEMKGAQPYLDWFESQFSNLARRYTAGRPEYAWWPGKVDGEVEEYETGWAAFLEKEKGKLEQKWWGLRPSQRGEKPWAYAPRIQTVSY